MLGLGLVGLTLLGVRPAGHRRFRAALIGVASAAAARALAPLVLGSAAATTFPPSTWSHPEALALAALVACADELVWRGVVQGALERELTQVRGVGRFAPRAGAAAAGLLVALVARPSTGGSSSLAPWLLLAIAPAVARAASGSVIGALVARLLLLATL